MFETVFTLIICGLVVYAFVKDSKPPSQRRAAALARHSPRARAAHSSERPPLGPLIRAAMQHHGQQLRGFVDGLLGKAPVIPMSNRLLPPAPVMGDHTGSLAVDTGTPDTNTTGTPPPDTQDLGPAIPELTPARREALESLVAKLGAQTALLAVYGEPEAVRAAFTKRAGKELAIAMGGRAEARRAQLKRIAGVVE